MVIPLILLTFGKSLWAKPTGIAQACRVIKEAVGAPTSGSGVSPEACGTYFESHSLRVSSLFRHLTEKPGFLDSFPEYRSLFEKPGRMVSALADHDLGKRLDHGDVLQSQYGVGPGAPTIKEDLARTFGKPFESLTEAERLNGMQTVDTLNTGDHDYSRKVLKKYGFSRKQIRLFLELEEQLDLFDRYEDSRTQVGGRSLDYGRELTPTSEFMLSKERLKDGQMRERSPKEIAKIKKSRAFKLAHYLETNVRPDYQKIIKPYRFHTYSYRKYALGSSYSDLVADQALSARDSANAHGLVPKGRGRKGKGLPGFLKVLGVVGAGITVFELANSDAPVINLMENATFGGIRKMGSGTIAHEIITDKDIFGTLILAEQTKLLPDEPDLYKSFIEAAPFVRSLRCKSNGKIEAAQAIFPQKYPFTKSPVELQFTYEGDRLSRVFLNLKDDLAGHKVSLFPSEQSIQFLSPVRTPQRWLRKSYEDWMLPTPRQQTLQPSYDHDYNLKNRGIIAGALETLKSLPKWERCCQLPKCADQLNNRGQGTAQPTTATPKPSVPRTRSPHVK